MRESLWVGEDRPNKSVGWEVELEELRKAVPKFIPDEVGLEGDGVIDSLDMMNDARAVFSNATTKVGFLLSQFPERHLETLGRCVFVVVSKWKTDGYLWIRPWRNLIPR